MESDSTGSAPQVYLDPKVRTAIRETLALERLSPTPDIDCPQCEIDQHDRCQKAEQVIVDLGVNTWVCCCEVGTETEPE